ncbi:hypothetical protein [Burkholderia metallica]|uniref:hypothetical protein n=1 Tax=Burkholderia metallica TaxID=488729 RepID=UPI001F5B9888|nr:hypothetical protein [Burkholderia metallica]
MSTARERPSTTHAAPAPPPSFDTWPSRIARMLRNAALRRPRASSAPLLSIVTLVLLVGGYVAVDRTCKADPVCRGPGMPGAPVPEAGLQASNDALLPVLPVPVYPFHAIDGTQVAANPPHAGGSANAVESAQRTAAARTAPSTLRTRDRARTGAVRVADWKGGRDTVRRTHAIRRVSLHTRHARRAAASNADLAKLYRAH